MFGTNAVRAEQVFSALEHLIADFAIAAICATQPGRDRHGSNRATPNATLSAQSFAECVNHRGFVRTAHRVDDHVDTGFEER